MVNSCCAINCKNRVGSISNGKKISFHIFPADKERRQLWSKAIRRADPVTKKAWIPGKTAVICSEHFAPNDFVLCRGVNVLKKSAVPSKFDIPQSKMEEESVERVVDLDTESETSSLPRNHHPRKLPNIPRNPEIYEPSPGIFKYIRKESKAGTVSTGDGLNASVESSDQSHQVCKPCTVLSEKAAAVELSVELECYDEATHNAVMAQQTDANNCASFSPHDEPSVLESPPSKTIGNSLNPRYTPQNLYRPPRLDSDRTKKDVPLPQGSGIANVQPLLPADSDNFYTLKAKLSHAMQLYTIQRQQLIKLSGRMKNLSRTNERLGERAHGVNATYNRYSPCLATDTKYVILFENLIEADALNTITTAINTSEKP